MQATYDLEELGREVLSLDDTDDLGFDVKAEFLAVAGWCHEWEIQERDATHMASSGTADQTETPKVYRRGFLGWSFE